MLQHISVKEVINKNDIVPLWQQAFGDSKDDIVFFINNVKDAKCFGCYVDDTLVSMLYFVKCNLSHFDSGYIYAACTFDEYKSNGYMSRLIDYCQQNYDNICLIPANESLVDFYKNRNFNFEYDISKLSFNQIDSINDYLLEGCSLKKPIVLMFRR